MRQILVFLVILLACKPLAKAQFDQNNLIFTVAFGGELPVGSDLKAIFASGANVGAGLDINTLKHHLYLHPEFNFSYYVNYYNSSSQENVWWWRAGLSARYYIQPVADTIRLNYYPIVGIHYNWLSNDIGPQPGYYGNIVSMLNANGLSAFAGAGIYYRRAFAEVSYNFYNPTAKVADEINNQLNGSSNGLYQLYNFKATKFDLSNIQFSLGVKFPLR